MPEDYYINKLYPFQNHIMKIISQCETSFYLTGGTALSRFYLNHRYSDDLDFFENGEVQFKRHTEIIEKKLSEAKIETGILNRSENFIRFKCKKDELEIKIDLVNDIPYRTGKTEVFPEYPEIDNWKNILTNKITAISRLEPKDIADILFICRRFTFKWEEILEEASKKVNYIDALEISTILTEFPSEYLEKIKWTEKINIEKAAQDIRRIAKNILLKEDNISHQL